MAMRDHGTVIITAREMVQLDAATQLEVLLGDWPPYCEGVYGTQGALAVRLRERFKYKYPPPYPPQEDR